MPTAGVAGVPCGAQAQQPSLRRPLGQSRRAREGAASGRAGKIITEEAREGGGEAGERLNETANALVIPACLGRRRQTAMLPAPATESARRDGLGTARRQQ